MKRREFLKKAGVGAAAVAATVVSAPAVIAQKKFQWKMVTTWPPKLPVLQDGCERLAKRMEEVSDGRLKIQVFAAGELVPPLESFQAVSDGTVEAGSGAAYYWAGKEPAVQWFAAVPFGMNAQGMAAWFHGGDGLKLWEECYAAFNLVPRPGGSTGVQMGGWFNKKIDTIDDFKGLKMRIPGLGGKVVAKAGGTVVLTAGGEIFTNLERGVIDATEWVGPLHDLRLGLYQAAKYYYYPGWHEPGTTLECMVNKQAFEDLPEDLQTIVRNATRVANQDMLAEYNARNNQALKTLVDEHNVELRPLPDEVLQHLKKLSDEVVAEVAAKDEQSRRVYEAFQAFRKQMLAWDKISTRAYLNARAGG